MATRHGATQLRRGALVQGLITLGLIVTIAVISLIVPQPPPPQLAELEPTVTAPRKITDRSNLDCAAECAPGEGSAATASPSPVPAPAQGVIDATKGLPSALQCYRWPDGSVTQTFDPQSPSCIAGWPEQDKGNGGGTSPGVSASAIRVAVPALEGRGQSPFEYGIDAFADFVNTRYQLWGRKIQLVPFNAKGIREPEQQRALALELKRLNIFASTALSGSQQDEFRKDLADYGIISMSAESDMVSDATLGQLAPYAWTTLPTLDTIERNAGLFSCASLSGRKAVHAGTPALKERTRTFAIVGQGDLKNVPDMKPLQRQLKGCGIDAKIYSYTDGDSSSVLTRATATSLREDSITTVIAVGLIPAPVMDASAQLGYRPEWVATGTTAQYLADSDWAQLPTTNASLFGLLPGNPWGPATKRFAYQVLSAMHRSITRTQGSFSIDRSYREIALLAAGIQAAGPNLTPQTFERGLQSLSFPNPGAGSAPYFQARVGFGPGRYALHQDFGLFWWDTSAPGNTTGYTVSSVGGWCYVQNGRRWSASTWPLEDPGLFDRSRGC